MTIGLLSPLVRFILRRGLCSREVDVRQASMRLENLTCRGLTRRNRMVEIGKRPNAAVIASLDPELTGQLSFCVHFMKHRELVGGQCLNSGTVLACFRS
jgi:hypothetical protein